MTEIHSIDRIHKLIRSGDKLAAAKTGKREKSLCSFSASKYKHNDYNNVIAFSNDAEVKSRVEEQKVVLVLKENPDRPLLVTESYNGHLPQVKQELHQKIDVNIRAEGDVSALEAATSQGHNHVVIYLLKNYSNVINKKDMEESLRLASEIGLYAITRLLLTHGAHPDMPGNSGVTALMLASRRGHERIVKLLLDNGSQPNIKDSHGVPALHYAIVLKHSKCFYKMVQMSICNLILGHLG